MRIRGKAGRARSNPPSKEPLNVPPLIRNMRKRQGGETNQLAHLRKSTQLESSLQMSVHKSLKFTYMFVLHEAKKRAFKDSSEFQCVFLFFKKIKHGKFNTNYKTLTF